MSPRTVKVDGVERAATAPEETQYDADDAAHVARPPHDQADADEGDRPIGFLFAEIARINSETVAAVKARYRTYLASL